MNQFTSQFFQAEFPGIPKIDQGINSAEFWNSKSIPFLDIGVGFDTASTFSWLERHRSLFIDQPSYQARAKKNHEFDHWWFSDQHSSGWKSLKVIQNLEVKSSNLIKSDEIISSKIVNDYYPDAVPDLQAFFKNIGLVIENLNIAMMEPRGWAQPHKDKIDTEIKSLEAFWMPLHDFPPSIKIYPYGLLAHKVGHLYLLNNQNFVHGVSNPTDRYRYAAVGYINSSKLSARWQTKIITLATNQWCGSDRHPG